MAVKNIVAKYSWELVYSYDSIRSVNGVKEKKILFEPSKSGVKSSYLSERFYFDPVVRSIMPEFLLFQCGRA